LRQIGLQPDSVEAAEVDESPLRDETPRLLATRLAVAKAERVAANHGGSHVLGADTVVALGRRVLPKAESGADVIQLAHRTGNIPIHAIVTETAASLFGLLSYRDPKSPLAAMSWGAEDLSAALGASSKQEAGGDLSFTYKLARSLCLAGAVAAGVQPVDGIFADFKDTKGLKAEAEAARRDGFTGKLAIHPAQVPIINAAFTPSADDVRHAKEVVAAFEAHPKAGVLSVGGKMVDRPHLMQARRILERAR